MEPKDYLQVIRSRLRLIALSVGVVVAGAMVLSLLQRPAYEGVAEIVVAQQNTGLTVLGTRQEQTSYQPGRDDVETQVQIVRSPRTASRVKEILELPDSVGGLLSRVDASADTGTNIISIRVTDSSAPRAAAIANAFAEAYIEWSRESQRESIKAAADDVEARLVQAQEEIVEIEPTATGPGATVAQQVKLEAARSLYANLADSLQGLRIAEQLATGKGSLLTSATVDPSPVSPSYPRNAGLGLSIGLLAGLAAVFAAERRDNPIRSAQDAEAVYRAPTLANIPLDRPLKGGPAQLAITEPSGSPSAEAYRMLRTNLGFVNMGDKTRALLVASAVPGEGKSTVAANLATVLARAGSRVVLVICDFHVTAAERFFFGLDYTIGLSDVLNHRETTSEPLQQPKGYDNLWVLPSGKAPVDPSELLGSEAMGILMDALRDMADWVILDSAPVLATADAAAVARWVDGVLVVSRVGVSRHEASRAACAQLANIGSRIVGLAVLGSAESVAGPGYYGYHSRAAR